MSYVIYGALDGGDSVPGVTFADAPHTHEIAWTMPLVVPCGPYDAAVVSTELFPGNLGQKRDSDSLATAAWKNG